jgi:hypothetical protein
MNGSDAKNKISSLRNNRILRRAIIPAKYHIAAKLMARTLEVPVGEIYDQAVEQFLSCPPGKEDFIHVGRKNNPPKISFWLNSDLSMKAKELAESLQLTEHEVLITAIHDFAKKHNFDRIRTTGGSRATKKA